MDEYHFDVGKGKECQQNVCKMPLRRVHVKPDDIYNDHSLTVIFKEQNFCGICTYLQSTSIGADSQNASCGSPLPFYDSRLQKRSSKLIE
jgi:hypothetical protein